MNWRALLLATSVAVPGAIAQENDASQPAPVDVVEEEIQVMGDLPGPPLWKVTKDDHVLWILGIPRLVPNDLLWHPDSIEHALAHSSEYLPLPSTRVFGVTNPVRARRLWKLIRRIPDRGTLEDVLPEDLYQLFSETRLRYAPKRDNLEELRPSVAAEELFDSAAQSAGLESGLTIGRAIEKRARKRNVKKVPTRLSERHKDLPLFDSTQEMSPEAEQTCLQAGLQGLDSQLEAHARLATAWAVGDLASIRAHSGDSATGVCGSFTLADPEVLSQIESRVWKLWLENVDRAVTDNDSTFAILPLEHLLRPDGPLSWLRQRGYEVREPDEAPPEGQQG